MDESESEEEMMVYVEFDGVMDGELFKGDQNSPFVKFLGMDTDQPMAQIDGHVFVGEYRDTPGTALFFQEGEPDQRDPVFSAKYEKQLDYLCKTQKELHMRRVFLSKKPETPPEEAQPDNSGSKDDCQPGGSGSPDASSPEPGNSGSVNN